jgi:hypothetical protein
MATQSRHVPGTRERHRSVRSLTDWFTGAKAWCLLQRRRDRVCACRWFHKATVTHREHELLIAHSYDDIFVTNADGSGVTNITNSPTIERDPDW